MNLIINCGTLLTPLLTLFLIIIFVCDITETCDLEQLSANGRQRQRLSSSSSDNNHILLQSIEYDVQNANIVFRGITTNIYGSAVHVTHMENGWDDFNGNSNQGELYFFLL